MASNCAKAVMRDPGVTGPPSRDPEDLLIALATTRPPAGIVAGGVTVRRSVDGIEDGDPVHPNTDGAQARVGLGGGGLRHARYLIQSVHRRSPIHEYAAVGAARKPRANDIAG